MALCSPNHPEPKKHYDRTHFAARKKALNTINDAYLRTLILFINSETKKGADDEAEAKTQLIL